MVEEHNINGLVLLTMTRHDWLEVGVKDYGDMRILLTNVGKLLAK